MKGILKFILFLEIVLLCSCVNDEKRSGAFGGMSLHLSANSSVTDVTTRSSEEVLPSIQDFSISVLQGDKVQASWDKLSDYDEDTTFPVGSYTLKAFYGDIEKEGFDSPYYEGTTDFNIRGGETTPVETTCKLANTKISIEYTDDFKQYFKTYSSTVQAELGSEVSFSSGETRAAYVKPGRISVKLTFTKVNGGLSPTTIEVATIEEALAQHHYHLQMNVDAGKAMLSIVFDRVTEVRPITLDISDKALNIKPPYFTLTGFEKTSNDGNQWDGNPIESNQYWLFSSGKKNGFKALIYMHRYQPDLLARMRTDYVHEQQERYRTQIQMLEDSAQNAAPSERVKLNKQITKLKDQALEIQKYEEKIHHLADQMISIDLDDGVKVNYAKFQDVLEKLK